MNTTKVDYLNIFLIILSMIIAFKIPFELFLFSYAVLGPLHYLTEINWLNRKDYFLQERKWSWIFIVVGLLVAVPSFLQLPFLAKCWNRDTFLPMIKHLYGYANYIILNSFFLAIILVFIKNKKWIIPLFAFAVGISYIVLTYIPFSIIVVSIFLPTIIHVYLFTWLFMLFGALNAKSKAGLAGVFLLLLVPVIIAISSIDLNDYTISEAVKTTFMSTGFQSVHKQLASFSNEPFAVGSMLGFKIQIFIAFAYTYHYLNWFSKTSVIGWARNISKQKLGIIAGIWILAVFLYWNDYKTGLTALAFLSFLHVILEFPLNITSMKGIAVKLLKSKNS